MMPFFLKRSGQGPVRARSWWGAAVAVFLLTLVACSPSRVRPPVLVERGKLDYPIEAKLASIQGDVVMGLDIDEHGHVEEATIEASSGYPALDEAALRYAQTLRFRPATIDGRPIRSHTQLLLKFRLTKDKFEPTKWVDQVLSLQSELKKATGEKRREILEQLLEAYVAFVRFAQNQGYPSLSYKVRMVVSPSVEERWRLFWGKYPTAFAVLDDFLERGGDVPDLRSIAESKLLEVLMSTARELRLKLLTQNKNRRQHQQMIAAIESYLDEHFPSLKHHLDPIR